jgi:16S rRNA processing protein RimM
MNRKTDRLPRELQDDFVLIGEVVKPHGIRGEIKVYPFSEQPENFKKYKKIVLQPSADAEKQAYTVAGCRVQGKLAIIQLDEIKTRDDAEVLQGSGVWLDKAWLPPLASDEYYWHQLKGLEVETETGRPLGRVTGLFHTAAHDIMIVSGTGGELMIPVKEDIVRNINSREGKVIITPPPGLLEMNK